jgi:hypothetical protein
MAAMESNYMFVAIIITCDIPKYRCRRRLQESTLNVLRKNGITPFYLVGGGETTYVKDDTLVVDVPETYENLPLKVWKGFEFFREKVQVGMFKMDDDTIITSMNLTDIQEVEYGGTHMSRCPGIWSDYHKGKCKDPIIDKGMFWVPAIAYYGGPFYYMSKSLLATLKESDYSAIVYEDIASGIVANRNPTVTRTLTVKATWGQWDNRKWPIIYPIFSGGLGNILFIMAAAYGVAERNNCILAVNYNYSSVRSAHSPIKYESNVLTKFAKYMTNSSPTSFIKEAQDLTYIPNEELASKIKDQVHLGLKGYFQSYKYLGEYKDAFLQLLSWNTKIADKYPKLESSFFIHIRRGDYVGNKFHYIDLDRYYAECIAATKGAHLYVFTNDAKYVKTASYLKEVEWTLVDENELDSLYLMGQCKLGGICANSSFSYWGAYLNTDRTIFMPSRWYPNAKMVTEGYYFPGVTVVEVE